MLQGSFIAHVTKRSQFFKGTQRRHLYLTRDISVQNLIVVLPFRLSYFTYHRVTPGGVISTEYNTPALLLSRYQYLILSFDVAHINIRLITAVNTSPLNVAYMRLWTGSSLIQVMAWRRRGAKPLLEPMLIYCQSDSWEQVSVKFELEFYHFHTRKCIWKCRLPKWRPFYPGRDEITVAVQDQVYYDHINGSRWSLRHQVINNNVIYCTRWIHLLRHRGMIWYLCHFTTDDSCTMQMHVDYLQHNPACNVVICWWSDKNVAFSYFHPYTEHAKHIWTKRWLGTGCCHGTDSHCEQKCTMYMCYQFFRGQIYYDNSYRIKESRAFLMIVHTSSKAFFFSISRT